MAASCSPLLSPLLRHGASPRPPAGVAPAAASPSSSSSCRCYGYPPAPRGGLLLQPPSRLSRRRLADPATAPTVSISSSLERRNRFFYLVIESPCVGDPRHDSGNHSSTCSLCLSLMGSVAHHSFFCRLLLGAYYFLARVLISSTLCASKVSFCGNGVCWWPTVLGGWSKGGSEKGFCAAGTGDHAGDQIGEDGSQDEDGVRVSNEALRSTIRKSREVLATHRDLLQQVSSSP